MPPHPLKGIHHKSRQVWMWLDMPGHTQPKVMVLHANVTLADISIQEIKEIDILFPDMLMIKE